MADEQQPDAPKHATSTETSTAQGSGVRLQQQTNLEIDYSRADTTYANMSFVFATGEEVFLDFALKPLGNPQGGSLKVNVSHRIVLSHYEAKRLAGVLVQNIQNLERNFGEIQVDPRQRAKSTG
jgi:hypothetical protein